MNCIHQLRADVLKALASHTRLHILDLLRNNEMTVCQITDALGANQSTISCHLNTLRINGLVTTRKQGTHVYYRLADETVNDLLALLDQILTAQCLSASKTLGCRIGDD